MVIGLLTLAAIPTTIAIAEGVAEQKKADAEKDDASRLAKFNVDVYCEANSRRAKEIHGKRLVLRDDKVWIDEVDPSKRKKPSHTVQAFFIQYPDEEREATRGLVSSVSIDPPVLNWVYVEKNTFELKYGNRTASREHHVGPWDWTEDKAGLTIEDWEGFVAVEEGPGEWAIYYDRKNDRLKTIVPNKRVMQISLERQLIDDQAKG